jgi:hypothetical protein
MIYTTKVNKLQQLFLNYFLPVVSFERKDVFDTLSVRYGKEKRKLDD